jgi:polysaccharide export outer membrane protein
MIQGVLMSIAFQKTESGTSTSSVALACGAFLLSASVGVAQTLAKPVFTPKAAPEPSSTQAAPATVTDTSRYVIGAEDSLQITVWQEPSLSGTFPVRPDGMISLALVGDLPAAGITPMQLGETIAIRLKKYIQDPVVSVVVTAVNSQKIFLVGEIQHVGPIALSPGMTPLQAIAVAGGLTPFTSGKHIYILRGPQGQQQKIALNYKRALKGDNHQNVSLLPGDTIVVP